MKLRQKPLKTLLISIGIVVLLAASRYLWNDPSAGSSFQGNLASNQSLPGNLTIN